MILEKSLNSVFLYLHPYPKLKFLDLASSWSNRLGPQSDRVPKLQFVFLRNEDVAFISGHCSTEVMKLFNIWAPASWEALG